MLDSNFINKYFFKPTLAHKIISFLLLPISFMYLIISLTMKKFSKRQNFNIKIISIGNLVSGGSGKTPFCISLVTYLENLNYKNIFIILRGYKRESSGLILISNRGKILCDVKSSGDEAMLLAKSTKSSIIVSGNREEAIIYAKEHNANIIVLDDAYRFNFEKFDILLEPENKPFFNFVLPSGYYRFPTSFYKYCNLHLKENKDYIRKTCIINQINSKIIESNSSIKYVFATAIANPARLDSYLPNNVVFKYYLADHANFSQKDLQDSMQQNNATHILMTQKDFVKCENFTIPIHILKLDISIDENAMQKILDYLH